MLVSIFGTLSAQTPNFSEDVAPIIYNNCSGCHHTGGIAPFPLMTYAEVSGFSVGISGSVSSGSMPPWPIDSLKGGFVHERILTPAEIQTIVDWASDGAPEGDANLAPTPPVFTSDYVLGIPDTQLLAPVYTSKATTEDDYVCFTIPTGLTSDKWVSAIEIIPGGGGIVHHALVFIDEDLSQIADTSSGQCGGPTGEVLLGEYVPGSSPIVYPNSGDIKFGVNMKAGSQLILTMHYPEGSQGVQDSTKVNLHFYPEGTSGIRPVTAAPVIEQWTFCIDSNSIDTISVRYPAVGSLPVKVSVMSVFPHMHLLGQEIKTWAITPTNDSIPLGSISDWDFEWQSFYVYKKLIVIPAGSVLYAQAIYDNTSNNHHNPNSPPKQVCAGTNTSDEMFLVYFQFLAYVVGDENIDINGILDPLGTRRVPSLNLSKLNVSPNPVESGHSINLTIPDNEKYTLSIVGLNGKVVFTEVIEDSQGSYTLKNELGSGVYLLSLKNDQQQFLGKVVVK